MFLGKQMCIEARNQKGLLRQDRAALRAGGRAAEHRRYYGTGRNPGERTAAEGKAGRWEANQPKDSICENVTRKPVTL